MDDSNHTPPARQMRTADYTPLERETRSHVTTDEAAFHLNRDAHTLRKWACFENGPLRPIRVNTRLAWAVTDIKRLLNGGE